MLRYLLPVLFFISLLPAQTAPWIRIDSVFAPAGIVANNFTCPYFTDINGDGRPDFLLGNSSGYAQCYINMGGSPAVFRLDTAYMASVYANGSVGVNYDYPFLADIIGDTLKELIIGGYNGLVLHENKGTAARPQWVKNDTLFQAVNAQIGTDPKPVFVDIDNDGDLDLFVGIGESLLGGPTPGITMGFRNTGSRSRPNFVLDAVLTQSIGDAGLNAYPCFADLDGDGDFDLLMGRDLQTFIYYKNNGTATSPVWGTGGTLFSGVETRTYWKDPVLFDYDGDGDFDLIYGSDGGKLYFYRNTGTRTAPAFTADASEFVTVKSDDNGATVSFGDWDRDGDPDFICGSWLGRFIYFRNDGTLAAPKFSAQTALFSSLDVGSYSHPAFTDIDNDGDLDIVSGELNGKIFCYINNSNVFTQNTTIFSAINVGGFSSPVFVDIDSDGDNDLLVGAESAGATVFYENTGNNVFSRNDTMFTGVSFPGVTKAAFADVDLDGDQDMFIGSRFGDMYFYRNTGTRFAPRWTQENDYLQGVVKARQNISPAVYRYTTGAPLSVVLGEYNGNFTFFSNNRGLTGIEEKNRKTVLPVVYPNPARSFVSVKFNFTAPDQITAELFSLTGEATDLTGLIIAKSSEGVMLQLPESLAAGVYILRLSNGKQVYHSKMLISK